MPLPGLARGTVTREIQGADCRSKGYFITIGIDTGLGVSLQEARRRAPAPGCRCQRLRVAQRAKQLGDTMAGRCPAPDDER